ncbi:MAG: hemerythrin [Halioglobus sp.]
MRKTSSIIWQDKQHQVLFEVLGKIKSANVGPRDMEKLQDYAENHFAIEEEYMEDL